MTCDLTKLAQEVLGLISTEDLQKLEELRRSWD